MGATTFRWFKGDSAHCKDMEFLLDDGLLIFNSADGVNYAIPLSDMKCESDTDARGTIWRLPDGSLMLSDDASLQPGKQGGWFSNTARSTARAIGLGIMVAVVLGWLLLSGIPALAVYAVDWVPEKAEQRLGKVVLDSLQARKKTDVTVDLSRRKQIEAKFQVMKDAAGMADAHLTFVPGLDNAVAFPGRNLAICDRLMAHLDDDQVLAILAHELGHIKYRHSTRRIVAHGFYNVLLSLFAPDRTTADMANLMMSQSVVMAHSRDAERAADQFAFDLLKQTGRSPAAFAKAMEKLADVYKLDRKPTAYASTHPSVAERIDAAKASAQGN